MSAPRILKNFKKIKEIENGNNENGRWIKFPDGTMIVLQQFTRTININKPSGVMYYTSMLDIPNFPISFAEVYSCNVTMYNNNACGCNPYSNDKNAGSRLTKCCERILVYAPELYENETITFNVTAIGRCK